MELLFITGNPFSSQLFSMMIDSPAFSGAGSTGNSFTFIAVFYLDSLLFDKKYLIVLKCWIYFVPTGL